MDFLARSCSLQLDPLCTELNVPGSCLELLTFVSPLTRTDDADSTSLELSDNLVFLWLSELYSGVCSVARRVATVCLALATLPGQCTPHSRPARHKLYASQVTWSEQHLTHRLEKLYNNLLDSQKCVLCSSFSHNDNI